MIKSLSLYKRDNGSSGIGCIGGRPGILECPEIGGQISASEVSPNEVSISFPLSFSEDRGSLSGSMDLLSDALSPPTELDIEPILETRGESATFELHSIDVGKEGDIGENNAGAANWEDLVFESYVICA